MQLQVVFLLYHSWKHIIVGSYPGSRVILGADDRSGDSIEETMAWGQ